MKPAVLPRRTARTVADAFTITALIMLVAGCGGGGSSAPGRPSGSSNHFDGASTGQLLAFSRCMRAHGVSGFPDPDSSGDLPKSRILALGPDSPAFTAAQRGCGHLLPNGGNGPTQAELQRSWSQDLRFAQCLRSHGVPNAPNPSSDNGRPYFNLQAAGIVRTPHLIASARRCQSLLHLGSLPSASGG